MRGFRADRTPRRGAALALLLGLGLALAGCDDVGGPRGDGPEDAARELGGARLPSELAREHPTLSPNASIETHLLLLEEASHPPHPGDGGGRMWLERVAEISAAGEAEVWTTASAAPGSRPRLEAGSSARFELVYEVGPAGVDEGGVVFFDAEPFWDWSRAQSETPDAPGFTTVRPRAPGVRLEAQGGAAAFRIRDRALEPGERIDVVYGAGRLGARVDRYAERAAEILAGSDADGDGRRAWSDDTPRVEIVASPARSIAAFAPAQVAPGTRFELVVSAFDPSGNAAAWPIAGDPAEDAFEIGLELDGNALGPERPPILAAVPRGREPLRVGLEAPSRSGTLRVTVRGRGALSAFETRANPVRLEERSRGLYWADLHGHSGLSDGTGLPDDYFAYARDVARLDAIALTDHDHWGLRPLDTHDELAASILDAARRFHEPGRFVTVPGFEWTSWLHGHRHVLYFADRAPIHSSLERATDRPDELWQALRGETALTFAHHSAGEPVATDWSFRPDPELEPVIEIASVHGASEAADAPRPVAGGIPGHFARDVLMRGERLGFIGSGDSHDGHPGLAQLAAGHGGLAGIFAEGLDRASLLAALRERRCFATNGIRPWLEVHIDSTPMGGTLPRASRDESRLLRVHFEATAPIERIDLVRSGAIATLPGEGTLSLELERSIPPLVAGEFHYVRIVQEDGGVAWSSPIFGPEREED